MNCFDWSDILVFLLIPALLGSQVISSLQASGIRNSTSQPASRITYLYGNVGLQNVREETQSARDSPLPRALTPQSVSSQLILAGVGGASPNPCGCIPPDPAIGVGPNHVFEMVNTAGIIYSKAGAVVNNTFALSSFFRLSTSVFLSDPQIIYDPSSSRWFASILEYGLLYSVVHVAVSTSSDPTRIDSWNRYSLFPPSFTLADQPFIGTSDDKFVISANDFNLAYSPARYEGVQYWVLSKSELLNGAAHIDTVTVGPDSTMSSLHPAQHLTSTSTFYMVTDCLGSCVNSPTNATSSAKLIAITGVPGTGNTTGSIVVTPQNFSINPSTSAYNATQPSTTYIVRTNDNRILSASWESNNLWLAWNDGCIPTVPTVDNATRSCLRLVQLTTSGTGAPMKNQDFDYNKTGLYFFYPAVSIYHGELIVVYGASSATLYPSLYATGRVQTDPANTLQTPSTIEQGTGYAMPSKQGPRYGDYFGAATDPSASYNSVFWVAGEYRVVNTSANWSTAIAQIGTLGPLTCTAGAQPTSGKLQVTVQFSSSCWSWIGSLTYLWQFNDGSGATSNQQNPTYTYTLPLGYQSYRYYPNATVTDSSMHSSQPSVPIIRVYCTTPGCPVTPSP